VVESRPSVHGLLLNTRDADEAAALLGSAAIPYVSETLPGSPPFSTRIFSMTGQLVSLSTVLTTGRLRVQSRLSSDSVAMVLDLGNGAGRHRWQDQEVCVSPEVSFVQSPLQRVEVLTTDRFELLFLKIRRNAAVEELEKMLMREVNADLLFAPGFQMRTAAGQRLGELVSGLRRTLCRTDRDEIWKSRAVSELEKDLITLLLQAQRHNYTRLLNRGRMAGNWQIRAAEEYMRANAHLPISLGDICQAAGVSARTLQHSFRRARGRSPMQLLRRFRMEEARAGLLKPDEKTSVTSEAARWGFMHFGRFSRAYRVCFGEQPSETLRRSRREQKK